MLIVVAILTDSVIFTFPFKGINYHSINGGMFGIELLRECCVFCRVKKVGYPISDNALQRPYKWNTAATYDPYISGNPLGALSDIY